MNIKNNSLAYMLRNVYFIAGTNCGGKSSMAKRISEDYGLVYYSADEQYWTHRPQTNKEDQPAMNRAFLGWDEFFMRDQEDKSDWLLQSEEEEMDYILLDLIALSNFPEQRVVVDLHCVPHIFEQISVYDRVVFLLAEPSLVREEYFAREDKASMKKVIDEQTSNPKVAMNRTLDTAFLIAQKEIARVKNSSFLYHVRTSDSSFEERVQMVAKHFKLL